VAVVAAAEDTMEVVGGFRVHVMVFKTRVRSYWKLQKTREWWEEEKEGGAVTSMTGGYGLTASTSSLTS
jgi:hypothetical protein